RYPFLSPLPRDSQAWESLLGSPVEGAHGGLAPQMYDMPVVLKKMGVTIFKLHPFFQKNFNVFHFDIVKSSFSA
ncbi:hypothetical protein, partial [Streptococcus varani]